MPIKSLLARLVGSVPGPETSSPPPVAAATPAPPPAAAPRPRLLLFGARPRAVGLLDTYALGRGPDVAISDRLPALAGHAMPGVQVLDLYGIDVSAVEVAIVTEDPLGDDETAISMLTSRGIPRDRIATISEPGRAHRLLMRLRYFSPDEARGIGYRSIRHNLWHRGNYAYGMILAAEAALRMSLKQVTAIEFGVWTGAGFLNMCEIADFLHQTLGVEFRLFGFDTGAGLPDVADWRDHPELWASGTLVMPDFEGLAARLPPNAKLIIGNVRETLGTFLAEHGSAEAPIGFVSLDVDQYHSSVSCLKVFDAEPTHLMPVVPMWVDDSNISVLQTNFAGEALAIHEFNQAHDLRKIDHKVIRTEDYPRFWHHCFWFAHIFDHPVRQGKQQARFDMFYHTQY